MACLVVVWAHIAVFRLFLFHRLLTLRSSGTLAMLAPLSYGDIR